MPFENMTPAEIKAEMDRLYAAESAYPMTNLWDADRMRRIREVIGTWVAVHETVLDIGCGDGSGVLPQLISDKYIGIDISEVAIEQARSRHPLGRFYPSRIEDFDRSQKFDLVIAIESIEHWGDVDRGLDVVREHLSSNGRFLLTTPNRDSLHHRIGKKLGIATPMCSNHHVREFGYEELKELLVKHGLSVIESEGVGLMPYWALESAFGMPIRRLTDTDLDVIQWLGDAGSGVPHLAFIQCHACKLT